MDFTYHYTKEQEEFRIEVRDWLDKNIPNDVKRPPDHKHLDPETFWWVKGFREQLGLKGWLYPTFPKEYGGGGLPAELGVVIQEELYKKDIPQIHDNTFDLPALMVWGTEEQKQQLLRPRLLGEKLGWQLFTEPGVGSDLSGLETRAVRDGDDWVITGQKVFVGGDAGYASPETKVPDDAQLGVGILYALAITDPNAPRHRNMGAFIIPGDVPGITARTQNLLTGRGKRHVFLDNVRIPGNRLIGGETQGWQVAQTTLEIEHGGGGRIIRDRTHDRFFDYVQKRGLARAPYKQQVIMQSHIDKEISRLLGLRNFWMYSDHQKMSYHGSQSSLWGKECGLRIADAFREVAGLYTLLDFKDSLSPMDGDLELHQRDTLTAVHPGGTVEIMKVIMARRIGLSRTREQAAPTPSTAGTRARG